MPDMPNFGFPNVAVRGNNATFAVHDIVRLGSGQQLIVTAYHPNRPANPWLGVLVGGQGKEYKFGFKHRPEKVGHADASHPALQAKENRGPRFIKGEALNQVRRLVDMVKHGQGASDTAKALATILDQVV